MGNKIEQLAIAHRIAMQDASMLYTRYQDVYTRYQNAIQRANKLVEELKDAIDEEIARRMSGQD